MKVKLGSLLTLSKGNNFSGYVTSNPSIIFVSGSPSEMVSINMLNPGYSRHIREAETYLTLLRQIGRSGHFVPAYC